MKQCKYCGFVFPDQDEYCSACGNIAKPEIATKFKNSETVKEDLPYSDFKRMADFMHDDMLYQAALCKFNGLGTEKSVEEALELFKILAFRGNYEGMYKLAEIYLEQSPPDTDAAYRWLKIAADGGHVPSKIKIKVIGKCEETDNGKIKLKDEPENLEALITSALPNIVSVYSFKNKLCSVGSGFIVEGGYVVSNAHVIGKNPDCITAKFEPGVDDKSYNLTPLLIAPDYDVAIMRFTGMKDEKISGRENLTFRLNGIGFGEEVYTVGNPHGIGLSVSHGVVSCPNRETDYPVNVDEVIQTDITVNHGNSGGALLDKCNNVIGMITFHPQGIEGGIAMCVPSKYIVKVLNELLKEKR